MPDKLPLTRQTALQTVAEALDRVRYGEIIIKVVDGRPEWIEIHEKTRLSAEGETPWPRESPKYPRQRTR